MSQAGLGLREEPLDRATLGAWHLGSSRNHLSSFIYYTLNTKNLDLSCFRETKTRLSYMSLAIDVAR